MNAQLHDAVLHELPASSGLAATSKTKRINLEFKIFAACSLTGLVLGVAGAGGGAFSGLCLAFGAILFGLSFIIKALQKAEDAAVPSE
jgi:hypothetical protein